ncbi:MAG: hypothetical protein DMD79_18960, partial [Candidatus Rokuibacteriota bacterium]
MPSASPRRCRGRRGSWSGSPAGVTRASRRCAPRGARTPRRRWARPGRARAKWRPRRRTRSRWRPGREGAVSGPESRIDRTFARLRARGERALVSYVCAGDPSLEVTAALVEEAARQGADLIEVGLPFSDPLADGPTIQRAGARALERGV